MAFTKEEKSAAIKDFATHPQDTGSVEVQIALLTKGINKLTEHCQANPKDFSSKRGLLSMVYRRRRFLRFIEAHDVAKYKDIIDRLGLRK